MFGGTMASVRTRISVGRQLSCQSVCLDEGPPRIFNPSLKRSQLTSKFQIYELGQPTSEVPHKTIVLVGATGAGKSTLINGLFNYIIGVEWQDQYRFKLVQEQQGNQAKSQTQVINVYTIHHQKGFRIPYSISFIDTPGYGDTAGVLQDNRISDQLRAFFISSKKTGISHIDAVGFVVPASLPRLTTSQQYIFDSILTLFGKDVAQNIYFLVTFADASKPQVLAGIQQAGLQYKDFFKFNNSVLYTCNSEDAEKYDSEDEENDNDDEFNEMYWKMGERSYRTFLNALKNAQSRSLQMTQKVMVENKALELSIKGLQTEIRLGLNKLEQLDREKVMMKQYEADLEDNRDFTYTIEEESTEAVPVNTGQYTTNCNQCKRTCHERCSENEDSRKNACSAMSNGFCTVCPGKCAWSKHTNQPYIYKVKRVTVTKSAEDLREKYEQTKNKYDALRFGRQLQQEFDEVENNVMKMVKDIRDCTARLDEIALKSNPMSTAEYIDLQLQTEQSQAEPGWQWRMRQLQKLRQQAEYKIQLTKGDFSPFQHFQEQRSSGSAAAKFITTDVYGDDDGDDDKYRHPKIEKLQTDLNLKEFLRKSPSGDLANPNPSAFLPSSYPQGANAEPYSSSSDSSPFEIVDQNDDCSQDETVAIDIGQFKKKLEFQLSKKSYEK